MLIFNIKINLTNILAEIIEIKIEIICLNNI